MSIGIGEVARAQKLRVASNTAAMRFKSCVCACATVCAIQVLCPDSERVGLLTNLLGSAGLQGCIMRAGVLQQLPHHESGVTNIRLMTQRPESMSVGLTGSSAARRAWATPLRPWADLDDGAVCQAPITGLLGQLHTVF